MAWQLSSTAFEKGAPIPRKYTGEGPDVSLPLHWTDPPQGCKSLALICDDPDAPVGNWVHWVIWAIPANARELPEAVPKQKQLDDGAKQGTNDFKKIGYGGPMPPPGPVHRYFFKLYALDIDLPVPAGATKKDLLGAMQGHVVAQTELMGRYKR
jgi:Raf kinase inhibitor-like YbhB/YbcL family protein